jgi:hypothetical protein
MGPLNSELILHKIEELRVGTERMEEKLDRIEGFYNTRIVVCKDTFATKKDLEDLKLEFLERIKTRDSWMKWGLTLTLTNLLGVLLTLAKLSI